LSHAPQAGIVHQLSVLTIGGVISPSEPLMLIVPQDDALVEADASVCYRRGPGREGRCGPGALDRTRTLRL
jgi:hypothetical protein